jgi:hypothetical protein
MKSFIQDMVKKGKIWVKDAPTKAKRSAKNKLQQL